MTLQLLRSEFPYIEENFDFFYQCIPKMLSRYRQFVSPADSEYGRRQYRCPAPAIN
jgi:hypothetical protein